MVRYCVFVAVTVYFACDFPKSVFIAHTNMYGSDSTVYRCTVGCMCVCTLGQVVPVRAVGSWLGIEVFNIEC